MTYNSKTKIGAGFGTATWNKSSHDNDSASNSENRFWHRHRPGNRSRLIIAGGRKSCANTAGKIHKGSECYCEFSRPNIPSSGTVPCS